MHMRNLQVHSNVTADLINQQAMMHMFLLGCRWLIACSCLEQP